MENFNPNDKEQLMLLLGEITETEVLWLEHREEFCELVNKFVEQTLTNEVKSCHLVIDSMNERVQLVLQDGRELEFIFKDFRSKRIRDHRNSKFFKVSIIETLVGQEKGSVLERFDLRVFKGNNEWVVRISDNLPELNSPFTIFPDTFQKFEEKDLGKGFTLGNPALISFSIISIFNSL